MKCSRSNGCIYNRNLCDGVRHCADGEDEDDCGEWGEGFVGKGGVVERGVLWRGGCCGEGGVVERGVL